MAEYLTPMNNEITIEEKQNLYAIRIRMFEISYNFTSKTENKSLCYCVESKNMKHIYECEHFNNGNLKLIMKVFKMEIWNSK